MDGPVYTFNGTSINLQQLLNKHGNNKIEAIKELKNITNLSLSEAKKVIDQASNGRSYTITKNNSNSSGKIKKPFYKKWWVWVVAIITIIVVASFNGNKTTKPSNLNHSNGK